MGIDLQRVAGAPKFLGGDDRRAAATERVEQRLAGDGVIDDRDLEQPDRFLCAVTGHRVVGGTGAAHRIEVRHLPDGGLRAIALPVGRRVLADGVPRGFMRPMNVAATDGEMLFSPDDLTADCEARRLEIRCDRRGLETAVPNVRNVAGKQLPGDRPCRASVIRHAADRGPLRRVRAMSPGRIVGNPVRRIGHHHDRCGPIKQTRHVAGGGCVAA